MAARRRDYRRAAEQWKGYQRAVCEVEGDALNKARLSFTRERTDEQTDVADCRQSVYCTLYAEGPTNRYIEGTRTGMISGVRPGSTVEGGQHERQTRAWKVNAVERTRMGLRSPRFRRAHGPWRHVHISGETNMTVRYISTQRNRPIFCLPIDNRTHKYCSCRLSVTLYSCVSPY